MKDVSNLSPWKDMRRCIVNPDHSVAYYLDESNSNLKVGGGAVNWSEVESLGQNCMVEIPKFYYSKKMAGTDWYFGVSMNKIASEFIGVDDWSIHPAFYRDRVNLCDVQSGTAEEVDFRYFGAFKGWVDGQGRLRSLPNKMPTVSKTIGAFRTHAKNMGVGYSQLDYYLLYAIQMLYVTEYGHGDSQSMIGRGYVDGNSGAIVTGATMVHGNNTYGETTGKKQMSYRGIEDLWGNVRHWVDGLYSDSGWNILVNNKGFNDTGAGYKNLGKGATANLSGNIGDIQPFEEAGFIIKTVKGAYDTYGLYDYGNLTSGRLPYAGGRWDDGSAAGAFRLHVNYSASSSGAAFGSLLCL